MKTCSDCGACLPLSAFGKDASRPPLFLQARCRPCRAGTTHGARTKARQAARFDKDLGKIVADSDALTSDPAGVLVVPFSRKRRRADHGANASTPTENWRALIAGGRGRPVRPESPALPRYFYGVPWRQRSANWPQEWLAWAEGRESCPALDRVYVIRDEAEFVSPNFDDSGWDSLSPEEESVSPNFKDSTHFAPELIAAQQAFTRSAGDPLETHAMQCEASH